MAPRLAFPEQIVAVDMASLDPAAGTIFAFFGGHATTFWEAAHGCVGALERAKLAYPIFLHWPGPTMGFTLRQLSGRWLSGGNCVLAVIERNALSRRAEAEARSVPG